MEQAPFSMPRIGDSAPSFEARSTEGKIDFPKDFKGKWVILFSHPADFTPVCTSEFVIIASQLKDFEELNCKLIGLSVDGLFSHIAWLRTIKEKIHFKGITETDFSFPLIEDVTMAVAQKYGMIQPGESDTKAVRAVFIIDPNSTIRTIIYYPLSVGRNIDEIKRVLIALQATDALGIGTPANWQPGDDMIMAPAESCEIAEVNMESVGKDSTVTCYDWFFCTKAISKEYVMKTIKEWYKMAYK